MNKNKFRMILMILIKSLYIYLSIQDLKWKKEVFDNYIIFVDGFCVLLLSAKTNKKDEEENDNVGTCCHQCDDRPGSAAADRERY
jgi:hypothetical protein